MGGDLEAVVLQVHLLLGPVFLELTLEYGKDVEIEVFAKDADSL